MRKPELWKPESAIKTRSICKIFFMTLLFATTSGCTNQNNSNNPISEEGDPMQPPFEDPIVLAERTGDTQEVDVVCLTGGAAELPRNEQSIGNWTSHLSFALDVPPTYTGYRAGYSLDGGDITWLPTVPGGEEARFDVEVGEGQWEEGTTRWHFFMEANLPDEGEQDCYTGGGSGALLLQVLAVPEQS